MALAFGEWDVEHLLSDMPLTVFMAWKDYFEIDGPTQERADLRTAIIAWILANVFRGKGARTKVEKYMPSYYMEQSARTTTRKTAAQMKNTLMAFASAQTTYRLQRKGRLHA